MSLRSEMKKYFIHEKADFIDDEEAVTDFDDLKDRDIDNDGDTDESDEYLHKRFGTIAKMDEEEVLDEAKFKKGDIVIPNLGPHKGDKHKIIHDFKDGSYNIAPLSPRNIKYKLGAAKAKETQLELVNEEDELDEMNTTSATPGYDTPNAFGNADEDTIEADGWKKAPKTNRIFKPMEGTSTFKKLMANMYNIGNGQPSINEAVKYDIEAAVKDIRNYNRGNYDKTDWGAETGPIDQLAKDVIKNLGFKASGRNIDQVVNHLDASSDDDDRIPEDADVVRELYPLLESVSYREYKKDPNSTPKQKVNKGIAEVNKMLGEMEKIVNNNLRLKQEAGVDSSHFWKSTSTRFAKINERMTRISNRLKELSK